jgi:hypothetical protein
LTERPHLDSRFRFAIPLFILGVLRVYGSLWIYGRFVQDGVFQTRWMSIYNEPLNPEWLYLFVAWDSGWYISLAQLYTFDPLVQGTFFPGYPALIKAFSIAVGNHWIAGIILSIILGFASLPIFQAVAEHYMLKGEALGCTLIMGSFPYVFVYTTVAYSESLFLFSVLAAWLLYLKGKLHLAVLSAALASFTKAYGILIVLPMLLDLLFHRRWKSIPMALIPAFLIGVFVYVFRSQAILTRMILEINTATWQVSHVGTGYFWIRDYVLPVFSQRPVVMFDYWHAFALALVVLVGCVAMYSAKTDWRLGVYSITLYAVIILFGFINGLIRYLSFIFPVWLNFRMRNPLILSLLILLLYIHSLIVWEQFLLSPLPL